MKWLYIHNVSITYIYGKISKYTIFMQERPTKSARVIHYIRLGIGTCENIIINMYKVVGVANSVTLAM